MNVNPKRRWMLAIVAIAVAAGVVGLSVLRDAHSAPRLRVLRQEQVNGQAALLFRFDAPKHAGATLITMSTVDHSTGKERRPVVVSSETLRNVLFPLSQVGRNPVLHLPVEEDEGPLSLADEESLRKVVALPLLGNDFLLSPAIAAEAGGSREFHVRPPFDGVWRLQCRVFVDDAGMRAAVRRVRRCWERKSLQPLGERTSREWGTVESELITNAVPGTADRPAQ